MTQDDPLGQERRAQAAQWFARLKTVPVSKATLDDFFEWRRDAANAQAFDEAEQVWTRAGQLGERPALLRLASDVMQRRKRAPYRITGRPGAFAIAGCFSLLVIALSLFFYLAPPASSYRTVVGEQRAIALVDGSSIHLNTDTKLDVRFKSSKRDIELESGEALFAVAHDRARPFAVRAGDVEVVATGTRFDIRYLDNQTIVTLLEGSVDIRLRGAFMARLRSGQQWRSHPDGSRAVQRANTGQATAWAQGRIVFDATPLVEAVAEINRYTQDKVVLEADIHMRDPISGSFRPGDPQGFTKAVTALLPLDAHRGEGGGIVLRRRITPTP
ncbi:MAG: FecR family protein [Sphingobium sp.]